MTQLIRLGSLASDEINDLVSMSAKASINNYDSFQMPIGTDYQVPNNKNFIVTKFTAFGGTANTKIEIGYADDPVEDTGTPPTNPVILTPPIPLADANQIYVEGGILKINTTKYPFIKVSGGAGSVMIAGIERDI